MLTDLNFLNRGEIFPPKCEQERMRKYEDHKKLFRGRQDEVYKEQFKRIERVINNFGQVISYPVVINYQKLITLKIIDMLLGEAPKIKVGNVDSPEQQEIDLISERSELINTAYMVGIDVSRFGDGLFYIYQDEEGGKVGFTQPCYWYPVVNPDNTSNILFHVIAYTKCIGEDNKTLVCQIHSKGSYESREYKLIPTMQGNIIGNMISSQVIQTGLTDFAVVQVSNLKTTDCVTGYDDYTDIDSIISEILVRVAQISKVLDKHASPSVTGPSSSIEQDHITGEWKMKMGKFFPKDSKDDAGVEYITWDGQLEASFKELEFLINTLYLISETGAILLGETDKAGTATSGTALKLKMMSPQIKVKRIRMRFDPALKKAIKLCSQLGKVNLTDKPISITWQDGIPNDEKELADIMSVRTGGKATISVKRALMVLDDLTESQAEEELEEITEEEAAANPLTTPPFSDDNNTDE